MFRDRVSDEHVRGLPPLCLGHTERVPSLDAVRTRLGAQLFARVAGPHGPQRRDRIARAAGPRWFAEDSAIRRVHADASMFVGGIRALLLQSLHPLAMAGVAAHSGFRGDPWGRLQRTSHFLAVTTFGSADDAAEMVSRINAIHEGVRGIARDGREASRIFERTRPGAVSKSCSAACGCRTSLGRHAWRFQNQAAETMLAS